MSERHKSSQRWRKLEAGWYVSPDRKYAAWRPDIGKQWRLCEDIGNYQWNELSRFLTLADCQEHAERIERGV